MKTLVKLFFIAALLGLIAGCNDLNETDDLASGLTLKKGHVEPVTVTVPFKADLVGEYTGQYVYNPEGDNPPEYDVKCEPPFYCRVVVDAEGTATHMGKVTADFNFCACGPSNKEIPYLNQKYGPAEVRLVAANGDKLFFNVEGYVVVDPSVDVHSYWKDKYEITGGTGRFEGAEGWVTTDDYNPIAPDLGENSFHHWTGIITMKKGKR